MVRLIFFENYMQSRVFDTTVNNYDLELPLWRFLNLPKELILRELSE